MGIIISASYIRHQPTFSLISVIKKKKGKQQQQQLLNHQRVTAISPLNTHSCAVLGSRLKLFVSICWAFWTIFAHNTARLPPALTTEQHCCCSGQKYMADSVCPPRLLPYPLPIRRHICLFPPVMEWAVNLAPADRSDPFSFSISICSPPTSCPADVFIADILV